METVETWNGNTKKVRGKEIGWAETREDLIGELRAIGVYEAQVQLGITETDLRIDGEIRMNARLRHPGVVLSFIHPKVGPMLFACDKWDSWQSNVRGIAKGLAAIRLVDRYGITQSFEQYVGFRALGSGIPMPAAAMSVEEAARLLIAMAHPTASDPPYAERRVIEDKALRDRLYKQGAKRLHPDAGGTGEEFTRFEEAKRVLDAFA